MRTPLALALAVTVLTVGCSDDGKSGTADIWETCRDHIQVAANGAIPKVGDFDATSVNIAEQGEGWLVEGTASPEGGAKLQFYCQLDADLTITDSIVTRA